MPEHLIRLRGGWRQLDPHGKPEAEAVETGNRVTLPWTGQAVQAGRVRLVRSFGRDCKARARSPCALVPTLLSSC